MEIGKKIQSKESGVTDGISRYLVSERWRRHRCDSGQASEFLYSSSSPKCSTQKQSSTICDFFSALTLGRPGYWKEEPSTTTSEFFTSLTPINSIAVLMTDEFELRFYVPLDTTQAISETFFPRISWHSTEETKSNTTKAYIHIHKL